MSSLNKPTFFRILFSYFPTLILFLSVFNEHDFNYLRIEYFSFNFAYILIFYWTLRSPNHLGYIPIFLAGIINDVIIGIPVGISSLSYLLICSVTAYIRNITISILNWCIHLIHSLNYSYFLRINLSGNWFNGRIINTLCWIGIRKFSIQIQKILWNIISWNIFPVPISVK